MHEAYEPSPQGHGHVDIRLSGTRNEASASIGALSVSFAYYKTGHARRGDELSAASPDIV